MLDRAREIDDEELPLARAELNDAKEQVANARKQLEELQGQAEREDTTDEAEREHDLAQEGFEAKQRAVQGLQFQKERLEEDRGGLAGEAARSESTDIPTLEQQARAAAERHEVAVGDHAVARSLVKQAAGTLEAAQRGELTGVAGRLIVQLRQQGILAQRLLDAITLDDAQRHQWEARLQPLQDAVVVAHADHQAAIATAKTLPGAVLVSAPASEMPAGIDDAPAEAGRLLSALEQQLIDNGDAVSAVRLVQVPGPQSAGRRDVHASC